jgi:predicted RNA-binding protein
MEDGKVAYYLDLFSPQTYEAFSNSPRDVSGFRLRQQGLAERIRPHDTLICYVTKVSRWCGLLEVVDGPFIDSSPIFYPEQDPFVVRFHVRPLVWLNIEKSLPIHEDRIWDSLSFTRKQDKRTKTWTGKIRSSLGQLEEMDGQFLERLLRGQTVGGQTYELDEADYRRFATHTVRRVDKVVTVSVPDDTDSDEAVDEPAEIRESTRVQGLIAEIGTRMGMSIWLPRNDKAAVLANWGGDPTRVVERLPLSYDDTTLKTIEQIDVLWLRGRSIVRAFEVEHTTSIYSGILRMADLLALQPNMDIRLHIVAPAAKKEKVFQEIRRPVFALLDRGPLSESCTYLSYESLRQLAEEKHLAYLSDSVLDTYAEEAE